MVDQVNHRLLVMVTRTAFVTSALPLSQHVGNHSVLPNDLGGRPKGSEGLRQGVSPGAWRALDRGGMRLPALDYRQTDEKRASFKRLIDQSSE